ncbi:MAG: hypothetical protein H8E44_40275 [Planctomycetes bacterium]|nr:hypothetical protein [Planctomycetota bacterium]
MRRVLHAELKKAKALWADELAKRGLRLQGHEVRGWRGSRKAEANGASQLLNQLDRDPQELESQERDL